MLADPEEGHYSDGNKAGMAMRPALFKNRHRDDLYTQPSPRVTTADMGVTSRDASFVSPSDSCTMLGWHRDWGSCVGGAVMEVHDDLVSLCWRQSVRRCVTALRGGAEEQLSFIRWRQQHSLGIHALKIHHGNKDAVVLGHCAKQVSTHESVGWFMCCALQQKHHFCRGPLELNTLAVKAQKADLMTFAGPPLDDCGRYCILNHL